MHPPVPTSSAPASTVPNLTRQAADATLWLLLFINLFNFIDRYILAAVLPNIESELLRNDPNPKTMSSLLAMAFLVTYTIIAPVFGWLGDRLPSRWPLIGIGIIVWSLASGASGLATTFLILFLTRCLIGIGEGAYAPVGLALLADSYPQQRRARVIAYYSAMIPVGSALGYALGTVVAGALDWRWAFYLVVPPGLLLGVLCFLMRDPGRGRAPGAAPVAPMPLWKAYAQCLKTPSYVLNLAGYTAMTFVVGGIAIWVPTYVYERQGHFMLSAEVFDELKYEQTLANADALREGLVPVPSAMVERLRPFENQRFEGADAFRAALRTQIPADELAPHMTHLRTIARTADSPTLGPIGPMFGGITVIAGLIATLAGSILADRLRPLIPSSDFFVAGAGALVAVPAYLAFLFTPFPYAWAWLFVTIFFLFLNTGPVNAITANVTAPAIRANAYALSILVMHALGDVISPPIIGWLTDRYDWTTALLAVSVVLVASGLLWLAGMPFLVRDMQNAESNPSKAD